MTLSFIGASIVLIVMIAFMLVTIRILIGVVAKRIYGSVEKMLYVYDDLFEKRKQKLRELSEKEYLPEKHSIPKASTKKVIIPPSLPIMGETRYQDKQFLEKYRAIREGFIIDKPLAITSVAATCAPKETKQNQAIEEVISFESLYLLSTLTPEEQLIVLRETLECPLREALDSYHDEASLTGKSFNAVDFYQKQKELALKNQETIVVKTGSIDDDFSSISDRVVTEYDPDLCEGIKIITADKCFDYGISRKELHCG